MNSHAWVGLGYINGVYGVQGWVRVFSFTEPREQILNYGTWTLADANASEPDTGARALAVSGRRQGKGLVAKLAGIDDRDAAAALSGTRIFVQRDALPVTAPGEYYWTDLIGLAVRTRSGEHLGTIEQMMETGAHDVIVLEGGSNRLIPFVPERVVIDVDLRSRVVTVDWDAAWWE